jgi:UDP-N-acetylmuramoylalanine--D-glutamate ligase
MATFLPSLAIISPSSWKLILGLGKTGVSIARFLTKQQVAFRVADNRNTPPFLSQFKGQ